MEVLMKYSLDYKNSVIYTIFLHTVWLRCSIRWPLFFPVSPHKCRRSSNRFREMVVRQLIFEVIESLLMYSLLRPTMSPETEWRADNFCSFSVLSLGMVWPLLWPVVCYRQYRFVRPTEAKQIYLII